MSEAGLLRAMARNYNRNNLWDHLDAEVCAKAANKIDELTEKIIEQAAVIEKLRDALGTCKLVEIKFPVDEQTHELDFDLVAIMKALSAPTDSKKILSEFMREQLGEPAGYFRFENGQWRQVLNEEIDIRFIHGNLFKLPECLK